MVRAGLVVVLLVVLLVLTLAWVFQRQLIYLPDRAAPPPVAQLLPGAREVTLHTADGLELGAWYAPPRGTDRRIAVLVASGNAGNRADRAPLAWALTAEGIAVLLFDYRGYGANPGSPSERGLARDVRAAQQYLVHDTRVPPDRQIYFGESLGAAVVTELATEQLPGGLLLRSPFVNLASVGRVHYPFLPIGLLLADRYPVLELIGRVRTPTVVAHGSADEVVPPAQSQAVAEAAPGLLSTVRVEGANHNDRALLDGDELIAAVVQLAGTVDRRAGDG